MDILTKIHKKLPTLSKGKGRIAQYLLDSCEQAAFQTAAEIGKTVQVSESTVVRFAADLGYDGYPEMQRALQERLRSRLNDKSEPTPVPKDDWIASVMRTELEQLRGTMEDLDRRAFDGAVETLLQAERIYLLAMGSTELLSAFFEKKLQCIFEDVRCVTATEPREILRQLVRISPRDALLYITLGDASNGETKVMEFVQNSGARVVALADQDVDCADHCLIVKRNSLTASISVGTALVGALAVQRKRETAEILEKLEEIWDVYHV